MRVRETLMCVTVRYQCFFREEVLEVLYIAFFFNVISLHLQLWHDIDLHLLPGDFTSSLPPLTLPPLLFEEGPYYIECILCVSRSHARRSRVGVGVARPASAAYFLR